MTQHATGLGATSKFRISLAEWSFHWALRGKQGPTMDLLDFAKTAKRDDRIEAVEYADGFFKGKARDEAYLTELKTRAQGVRATAALLERVRKAS
jgi:L-ribulose-5-phosphate 3-epimerase